MIECIFILNIVPLIAPIHKKMFSTTATTYACRSFCTKWNNMTYSIVTRVKIFLGDIIFLNNLKWFEKNTGNHAKYKL